MNSFGSQTMVRELKHVVVSPPNERIGSALPNHWHYRSAIDGKRVAEEHSAFVRLLKDRGVEVISMRAPRGSDLMDLMFAHDGSVVIDRGAVLMRMGKVQRRGEESVHGSLYETISVPILGQITEPGTMEGGDCFWLLEWLLAVGLGPRTNEEGARQMRAYLEPFGIEIKAFVLGGDPSWKICLYIMTTVSLLRKDLALVARPLFPAELRRHLDELGIEQIDAPVDELAESNGISANVLALGPGRCLMIHGFSVKPECSC